MSIGAGFLYDATGFSAAFALTLGIAIAMALAAARVPDIARADLHGAVPAKDVPDDIEAPVVPQPTRPWLGSAGVALRVAPRLRGVLVAVMLVNITIISGFTYLPLRLGDLGSPPSDVALAAGVSAFAEIPAMLVAAMVARRIGLRGMFVSSALIYGAATSSWILLDSPAVIIATRAITGVAFAWVLVCVVLTIARLLPGELQGTGQSLYQTVAFGIGAIVANLVGGFLYGGIGHAAVFGLGTLLAIVAAAMGWFAFPRDGIAATRPAAAGPG